MNNKIISTLTKNGFTVNGNIITYKFTSFDGHLIYTLDSNNDIIDIDFKAVLSVGRFTSPGYVGVIQYNKNDRPSFFDTDYQRDLFKNIHTMIQMENRGKAQQFIHSLGDEYNRITYTMDAM